MKFSQLLDMLRPQGAGHVAPVPEDWLQGRSAFGGLQAALAVRAMRALVPADLPLRTLQVTFLAPVPAGETVVSAQLLRRGKSTVHCEARLGPAGAVQCLAVGIFGAARPSVVSVVPRQPAIEEMRPLEFRYIDGVTPNFTRHFRMRWLRGGLPYTGNPLPAAIIEVGIDDTGPVTESHVLAIADAIPPVALAMLKKPAAGSSMTWTIEFLRHDFADCSLQGWRLDVDLVAAGDGYTSQSVLLWNSRGEAVALSRQSMVVFG